MIQSGCILLCITPIPNIPRKSWVPDDNLIDLIISVKRPASAQVPMGNRCMALDPFSKGKSDCLYYFGHLAAALYMRSLAYSRRQLTTKAPGHTQNPPGLRRDNDRCSLNFHCLGHYSRACQTQPSSID